MCRRLRLSAFILRSLVDPTPEDSTLLGRNFKWSRLFTGGRHTHNMRSRNRYPKAIVDMVVQRYGLKPGMLGADVGAASGRLVALFLEHGYKMVAIEHDEKLRQACSRLQDRWPDLEVCHGTPVATGLSAQSVDFVVSQRGLYWADQPALRREFRRILRPGGVVLFIADSRVYGGAAQTEAYEAILRTYCRGFREKTAAYDLAGAVAAFFHGGDVYEDAFVAKQTLSLDTFMNETSSLPICPHPGDPQYQPLLRALRDYFEYWAKDGVLTIPTVCRVACGRLAG
jgi:SAM-dependent methyltransferase